MLKKIFRAASFAVFSIALITSIFLAGSMSTDALVKGWTPIEEGSSSSGDNGDNPLGIVIAPSENRQNTGNEKTAEGMNMGDYPDLGSDQVFPFVAGLDSYQ